jgi:hypothetical protein
MINPYQELTTYEEDNWSEYLERICLYDIFKDLIEAYGQEPGVLKCVIRFIVWAYSKDSDKVVLGGDWLENKKRIYEAAAIPPTSEMQDNILYLKDRVVLSTVKGWLNFQDDDTYKEIKMLKDLRVEMQISANSPILKATGEIDYEVKFKCAKYSIELYQMINDAEQKLLQNDPRMKEAFKEVKAAQKVRDTLSPELFSK